MAGIFDKFGAAAGSVQTFVQKSMPRLQKLIKWSAFTLLSLASISMTVVCAAILWSLGKSGGDVRSWLAFGFLSLVTVLLARRTLIKGKEAIAPEPYKYPPLHVGIRRQYQAEIDEELKLFVNNLRAESLDEILSKQNVGDRAAVMNLVKDALKIAPDCLITLCIDASDLTDEGRYVEAEEKWRAIRDGATSRLAIRTAANVGLVACLLFQQRRKEARELADAFIAEPVPLQNKLYLLDCLACIPHHDERPDCLPEADRWSELALQMQPETVTLRGTRSSILFELGRIDESEPMLNEVLATSEADNDKGVCLLYLALCAERRGDVVQARRLARKSKLVYSEPWMAKRLEHLV